MLNKVKNLASNLQTFHLLIIILLIGLFYGGFSLYVKIAKFSEFATKTRITSVKVSHITLGTAKKIYQTISTIEALRSAEITAKVNGVIEKINFIEGDEIKKGEKIFSILSSDSVGRIEIHAPFKGKIGLSNENIGEQVSKGRLLTSPIINSALWLSLIKISSATFKTAGDISNNVHSYP